MEKTQKTKKVKRINFVDWILIAIALAAVVSFVYFAFFSELNLFGNAHSDVTVQYTLRVEKLNTDLLMLNIQDDEGVLRADFLSDGDKVYDSVSGKQIGKIASIKYVRSTEKTGNVNENNGTLEYAPCPGYVNLIITVIGAGSSDSGVISINGYEIKIGDEIGFRTDQYDAIGKCTYVSGKEKSTNDK